MSKNEKLWDKGFSINAFVEKFTVGKDRELDEQLATYDILGSLAHTKMLCSVGLLTEQEHSGIESALIELYHQANKSGLPIEEGIEDIHSQVEILLTRKLGDLGKKIHSARSRNDQVLLDLRLFSRHKLHAIAHQVKSNFELLQQRSEENKDVLLPGYTHLQVAMPSSFGLWFGAYAESLVDDLALIQSVFDIVNQNPLGSAAGYGSSFPIKREQTTKLLGFNNLCYNVIYAQMGRGKTERIVAMALSSLAATISKFAYDACLFMSQNFGFISLPDQYTTGSSIMPHKKNPDVFEVLRAKCNQMQSVANELTVISNNLPSGYFRDMQILKEPYFMLFNTMRECLQMVEIILPEIKINQVDLNDPKYKYIFSVEEVNKLVLNGVPFRDAYKQIGMQINKGGFNPSTTVEHTHEGSVGNLCTQEIKRKFSAVFSKFKYSNIEDAENALLKKNCND